MCESFHLYEICIISHEFNVCVDNHINETKPPNEKNYYDGTAQDQIILSVHLK